MEYCEQYYGKIPQYGEITSPVWLFGQKFIKKTSLKDDLPHFNSLF